MTSELFVKIIMCIITICFIIITTYLIPYIKNKIGDNNYNKLLKYIAIAVRCAEQIFEDTEAERKKEYVMEQVQSFINTKLKIDITYDELNTLVEGIVNEVKYGGITLSAETVEVTEDGIGTAN
jgi:hypothetical protein